MKQAVLTFEKCQVVLIESDRGSKDVFRMKDPPKRMKLIGKLSELTEEQAKEIVSKRGDWYANYPEERLLKPGGYVPYVYTAIRSFYTMLKANGWDTEVSKGAKDELNTFCSDKTWVFTIKPTPTEEEPIK